tara:strand:+ start:157 stop:687 length:531 start_codon:yes stop_codon:yes gene_type:complete
MNLLENYLKSLKVQKVLNTKPGEEGFSLVELVVVIAVLAILSAVAIPAFVGVQANARASAVKNGLVNGIKECVVRAADNKSTDFIDAQSFANASAYQGYTVGQVAIVGGTADTCYSAVATPDDTTNDATFTIVMNPSTGVVTKTCDDDAKPGCNEGVSVTVGTGDDAVTTTGDPTW